jgi:hypothetical protein
MSSPINGNTVSESEPAAEITTFQMETVWDDASDSELEARISKDPSYGTNYC